MSFEFSEPPAQAPFELAVDFHAYQKDALKTLWQAYKQGERQLHLVAPPGAGKTLLGLEMIRRVNQPAVILSPNTTIQSQWLRSFQRWAVFLDDVPGLPSQAQSWISKRFEDSAPILSLTYQKVSVKGEAGLHDNVEALFDALAAQGYRLLVLDECHHLLAHWARAVQHFGARLEESTLLGLTATPPVDRAARELQAFFNLVGDVNFEISMPAVIREGHLAPFQDLVYLVRPNEAEHRYISGAHQALHQLIQGFKDSERADGSLALWAESWLLSPQDHQGRPIERLQLLSKMPARSIACLRFLNTLGLVPLEAPWCPEAEDPMELEDWAELLGGYGQAHLKPQAPEVWSQLCRALSALGYRYERQRFVPRQGALDRVLAFSGAKLRALEAILSAEWQVQGSELRCLVLTDFESTHAPGQRKALEGVLDPEAGGALAAMRCLCAHSELAALQPILVTGSTLLCAQGLRDAFLHEIEIWRLEQGYEFDISTLDLGSHVQISGRGRDWTSAHYLAFVTQLLNAGISQCLIGTRGLVGEGWDCQVLNTLIDLTSVSSYVSVNQIRGRSLRIDPERPLKLANNWDVVAILPEMEGGFRDFLRFEKKHRHFFGLSDDGQLEKGVGHVHPQFEAHSQKELLAHLERLNQDMIQRAQNRRGAYEAWQVGKAYRNQSLHALHIQALPLPESVHQQALGLFNPEQLPVQQQRRWEQLTLQASQLRARWLQGVSAGGVLALLCGGLLSWPLALSVFVLFQAWLVVKLEPRRRRLLQDKATETQQPSFYAALAQVLVLAFHQDGWTQNVLHPEILRRSDGSLRVLLHGASDEFTAYYMQAYRECLEPVGEQRYVLKFAPLVLKQTGRFFPHWHRQEEKMSYLPLPHHFARSREKADIFHRHFSKCVAVAELIYTRRGAGQAEVLNLQRQRALWNRTRQIEIWE